MRDPDITKPHYRIARAEAQARAADNAQWRMYSQARAAITDALYLMRLGDFAKAQQNLQTFRDVGLEQARSRELDNSSCMPAAVVQGREAAGD